MDKLLSKYNDQTVRYISAEELQMNRLNDSVIIVDAREWEEFEVSHLPDAVFIGYSEFSSEDFSKKFKNKSAPIVVYCTIGIRSENIAKKIKDTGYLNVSNLYGGIFEWKNTGYPVFSKNIETEKVHAYSKAWSKWLKNGEKVY
ncbi:rhodanese-like domain-containing protein [Gramella sp. AN32]|uniref:Rhodanese-like domain-containing protein n=1 Tax=Christiangramia antarctica TaxID=2058158 RepID=A0ABW5X960_9FLAO|nr:rhodanese-like domain-containing protein [Gramella sp. AN32]